MSQNQNPATRTGPEGLECRRRSVRTPSWLGERPDEPRRGEDAGPQPEMIHEHELGL